MKKIFTQKLYIVISIIVACIIIALFFRSCFSERKIRAYVSPLEIEVGQPIHYSDSTLNVKELYWQFGDGEYSFKASGDYIYKKPGKYQIKISIDRKLEQTFIVNVRPRKRENTESQIIRITAPTVALQDEYIMFRGEGTSKEWRWEFGETGMVDARDQVFMYKYKEPGVYEVRLNTEETQYYVSHFITIEPKYQENDSTSAENLACNDIREKLQAIVDQKPFNTNYNHILSSYLCNNSNTLVLINNTKKNDFYSYCQGIRLVGKKKLTIENVLIDIDPEKPECVQKLTVIQTGN